MEDNVKAILSEWESSMLDDRDWLGTDADMASEIESPIHLRAYFQAELGEKEGSKEYTALTNRFCAKRACKWRTLRNIKKRKKRKRKTA